MSKRGQNTLYRRLPKFIRSVIGEPTTGAEIGVWRGKTSLALLRAFPQMTLLMVDRWQEYECGSHGPIARQARMQEKVDEAMNQAIVSTRFAEDRRVVMVSNSHKTSEFIRDDSLDFVFIDGDHCYGAVLSDIADWTNKVRLGGLVCGHDYPAKYFGERGVKRAVDEYTTRWKYELKVEEDTEIWWFLKQ